MNPTATQETSREDILQKIEARASSLPRHALPENFVENLRSGELDAPRLEKVLRMLNTLEKHLEALGPNAMAQVYTFQAEVMNETAQAVQEAGQTVLHNIEQSQNKQDLAHIENELDQYTS